MSSSEESYLDALVNDSASALTAADASALRKVKLPVGCILKAVAVLVGCGIKKPECIAAFVASVLACVKE